MVYLAFFAGAILGMLCLLFGLGTTGAGREAFLSERRQYFGAVVAIVGAILLLFSIGGIYHYFGVVHDTAVASAEQILINYGIAPDEVGSVIAELESVGWCAN